MNYNEWLRELGKLPKTAEFCMLDVTERISSGNYVLNFLITEAAGNDIDPSGRRGQKIMVCRPRIYLGMDDMDMSDGDRVEVTEPYGDVDKEFIRERSSSLHEFFLFQPSLCESVLSSLAAKIAVISERSSALLESQLGDEVVKLVTKRLKGEEIEDASLKNLLVSQVTDVMKQKVIPPIRRVARPHKTTVRTLEIEDGDLKWKYEYMAPKALFVLGLQWKSVKLKWNGMGINLAQSISEMCVRDIFLCLVNLPSFGQAIAEKLAKIME